MSFGLPQPVLGWPADCGEQANLEAEAAGIRLLPRECYSGAAQGLLGWGGENVYAMHHKRSRDTHVFSGLVA